MATECLATLHEGVFGIPVERELINGERNKNTISNKKIKSRNCILSFFAGELSVLTYWKSGAR